MNLTSQYVVNPKSRDACLESLTTYKSIRTTNTRLRLSDDRQILNLKERIVVHRFDEIEFKMIRCPSGMFKMGNVAKLTLIKSPFLLGETEVTQEIFENVMGYNPSSFIKKVDSKQRPVESVTWYDAVMFCNNLSVKLGKKPYYYVTKIEGLKNIKDELIPNQIGYADVKINPQANGFRLPCEKEWEYAAKAGTNNKYAGTNDVKKLDQVAWFEDNSGYQTHPVKGKRPNEWGFYDMNGNVEEWCWDFDKSCPSHHIARGGEATTSPLQLTSTFRIHRNAKERLGYRGFRISASLVN